MLDHVIGTQKNASTSKNTFLSETIPLSKRVPEKVKNQIWANEKNQLPSTAYCHLAKTDVRSAFRIIPVNPADYYLLDMHWKVNYY